MFLNALRFQWSLSNGERNDFIYLIKMILSIWYFRILIGLRKLGNTSRDDMSDVITGEVYFYTQICPLLIVYHDLPVTVPFSLLLSDFFTVLTVNRSWQNRWKNLDKPWKTSCQGLSQCCQKRFKTRMTGLFKRSKSNHTRKRYVKGR